MPYPVPTGTDPHPETFKARTASLVSVFVEDDAVFEAGNGEVLTMAFRGPYSRPLTLFFRDVGQVKRLVKALVELQEKGQ